MKRAPLRPEGDFLRFARTPARFIETFGKPIIKSLEH
jgi:hypothetical protein